MRVFWLLLFFPSFAFALMGCPADFQVGSMTIATKLPACIKYESSQLGGCIADCAGVCVEYPLANKKGPIKLTGNACNWQFEGEGGGGGNGDSDGSGNTPDEGNPSQPSLPKDWDYFQPVIGDSTGTSVSAAVAKLNSNLGKYMSTVTGTKTDDSANLNTIAHSAESVSRDMKTSMSRLASITDDMSYMKVTDDRILDMASASNDTLKSIDFKIGKITSGGSGSSGGGSSDTSSSFGPVQAHQLEGLTSMMGQAMGFWSGIYSLNGEINQAAGRTASYTEQNLSNTSKMVNSLSSIEGLLGSSGSGSDSGASIDYSKMPGSGDNPLSVKETHYVSKCMTQDCYFDVAEAQKKQIDVYGELADKHLAISAQVKEVFSFNLTGSAEVMECLDLFSFHGKEYTVCPPAGDYWKTLASLMMFIFGFVALMIIFKR